MPGQSDLVLAMLRAAEEELAARAEQAELSSTMLRAAEAELRRKDGQLALQSKQLHSARADLRAQEPSVKEARAEAATLRAALRAATMQLTTANRRATDSERMAVAERFAARKSPRGPSTPACGRADCVSGAARLGLSRRTDPAAAVQGTAKTLAGAAGVAARAAKEAAALGAVEVATMEARAVAAGTALDAQAMATLGRDAQQSARAADPSSPRRIPPTLAATLAAPSPPAFSVPEPERLSSAASRAAATARDWPSRRSVSWGDASSSSGHSGSSSGGSGGSVSGAPGEETSMHALSESLGGAGGADVSGALGGHAPSEVGQLPSVLAMAPPMPGPQVSFGPPCVADAPSLKAPLRDARSVLGYLSAREENAQIHAGFSRGTPSLLAATTYEDEPVDVPAEWHAQPKSGLGAGVPALRPRVATIVAGTQVVRRALISQHHAEGGSGATHAGPAGSLLVSPSVSPTAPCSCINSVGTASTRVRPPGWSSVEALERRLEGL